MRRHPFAEQEADAARRRRRPDLHLWRTPVPSPLALLLTLRTLLVARVAREDGERGDVPGWVLITLMTAGIVAIIWGFAEDRLLEIVTDALESVTPA
jgi:hypothetical protein